MAGNLTDEQRKWILKQYWKTENCIPTFAPPLYTNINALKKYIEEI